MKVRLQVWVMVLAALVCGTAMGADYEVKLARPSKAGDEIHKSSTAKRSMKMAMTVGEKVLPAQEDVTIVTLEADEKVLEVNKKGGVTKAEYKIEKLTLKQGDADATEVAKKDSVMTGTVKEGKAEFEIDGKKVEGEQAEAIDVVAGLAKTESSDDDSFGTKDRKAVGDKWPVNAEAAANDAKANDVVVSKENIKGETTLVKVAKVNGVECQTVKMEMSATKITLPMPPGMKITDSEMSAQITTVLPTDSTKQAVESAMEMTLKATASGKPGADAPEMTMKMSAKIEGTTTYTAVKGKGMKGN